MKKLILTTLAALALAVPAANAQEAVPGNGGGNTWCLVYVWVVQPGITPYLAPVSVLCSTLQ